MKRLMFVVLLSSLAFSQAAPFDGVAQMTGILNGVAVVTPASNASITVCGYPATGGIPCTNRASICPDESLTGCSTGAPNNPITSDAQGNFKIFAASGVYQYTVCPQSGPCYGPYDATVGNQVNGQDITPNSVKVSSIPPIGFASIWPLGDSLTQGIGTTGVGNDYPSRLSALLGYPITNGGICGQNSIEIAQRAGVVATTATVTGGSIPTSGSVNVTFSPNSPAYGCGNVSVLGTIAGVTGNILYSGGTTTFTPTVYPASPVAVAPGSLWTPSLGNLPNGLVIIWAGKNDSNPTATLANIALMAAAFPNHLILGVTNSDVPDQWPGGVQYATNAATNATLAATYGSNFIDINSYLSSLYDPSNPQDVIDHSHNLWPSTFRSAVGGGTLTAAVTTTGQTSINVSNCGIFSTLIVGSEKMEVTSCAANVATVIRGYAGTTAATYLNGTAFTAMDSTHFNTAGYAAVANRVYTWIRANQTQVVSLAGIYDVLSGLAGSSGSSGSSGLLPSITSPTPEADLNNNTKFPWGGWANASTLNTPVAGRSYYVSTTGIGGAGYVAQIATDTGPLGTVWTRTGYPGPSNWNPWVQVSGGANNLNSTPGTPATDLNSLTSYPWAGWANASTLNVPTAASYFVLVTGVAASGYTSQLATDMSTGAIWTRSEHGGVWSSWVQPATSNIFASGLTVDSATTGTQATFTIQKGGDATTRYQFFVDAGGALRYSNYAAQQYLLYTQTGALTLNSYAAALAFNTSVNSNGGVSFGSGGASPSIVASVSNAGLMTANGGFTTPLKFTSTVATGTAPLTVSSTTVVPNLNVDQLDGLHATAFEQSTSCGTTTTCSNTAVVSPRLIRGEVTLSSGTATITGISPAFTSTSTYVCTVSDTATTAAAASYQRTSSSSITIKGGTSAVISYICVGS